MQQGIEFAVSCYVRTEATNITLYELLSGTKIDFTEVQNAFVVQQLLNSRSHTSAD